MRFLLVSLCLLAVSVPARAQAPSAPPRAIVIIVAAGSPVTSLTVDEVRRIFTETSLELRPLNLPPGTPERVSLDRALFGRGPDDVARFWIERKIRGQGGPPRVIPSARLITKIVARVPGAIGYVADGPLPPDVKVVRIGGLVPGHPRYPFRISSTP
jgi:hypothetical protein